jgi:tetratricopeptide (TPR) repeat protein
MWRGFLVFLIAAASAWGASSSLERADKLFQQTDYEGSLAILVVLPQKDARVFDLIGRNQFMLGDYKKASESYQQAVLADPGNSSYENWLGRAFGKRAETASPFTAPGLASKARQHFERALALDAGNKEAASDLFEYYLEAPGFLGGGLDKAAKMAGQMALLEPAEGLWAQARIAERRKDYGKAEEQLRRAMQAAPMQIGRALDLAKFLSGQGRIEESEQAFGAAEKIAPNSPRLLYARAETYIKSGRNIETARTLLKRYLAEPLSPDDPPRQQAEKLLRQAGS